MPRANDLSGVVAHELSGLTGTEEVPHDQDTSAAGDPTDEIRGGLPQPLLKEVWINPPAPATATAPRLAQ